MSERTRAIVVATLPLIEQHRRPLEEALKDYMARQGPPDPSPARTCSATAGAITDMLLDHAGELDRTAEPAAIAQTARRHRALAIGGQHYSRSGMR